MDDLLEMEDVACTAYSIINHYVRFVDADPETGMQKLAVK